MVFYLTSSARARIAAAEMLLEWDQTSRLAMQLLGALHGDGEPATAREPLRVLRRSAQQAGSARARLPQFESNCVIQQWLLAHGDTSSARAAIAQLKKSDALQSWLASTFEVCAAVLDAWLAVHAAAPDVTRRLERVDSILLSGQAWNWPIPSHRILARLWESRHEWARALAAIRRRNGHRLEHLAGDLRHEGRLAALAGDTAGSLRAYRHYLSLRSDPEPALRPQRDSVSAEVRQLLHQH